MPAASGFAALRTPLLPFAAAWLDGLAVAAAIEAGGDVEGAVIEDRARLRAHLRELVARPEVRHALFLASPDLEADLAIWESEPEGRRGRKLERAIVRYVARMAARPTPFGLFAGGSVAAVGGRTRLALGPLASYRPRSRIDMHHLHALTDELLRDEAVRSSLVLRPNDTLYRAGRRWRFAQTRILPTGRTHHLVALPGGRRFDAVVDRARRGATLAELRDVLVELGDDKADAVRYVESLARAQVLVSDLAPLLTGPPPGEGFLEAESLPASTRAVADGVRRARVALAAADERGPGTPTADLRAVAEHLAHPDVTIDSSKLIQVDLVKPTDGAAVGTRVADEVARAVTLLHAVFPGIEAPELRRFRDAFTARYETREVPLVEVLDPDLGIGFDDGGSPTPLLAGLPIRSTSSTVVDWHARHDLLVRLATSGVREVVLEAKELLDLADPADPPLPDAYAAVAVLAAPSGEAVDDGDFQVWVRSYEGPSGARLMGRFCHADPELRQHVEQHLRAEEALDPDAVFAEIVHLPEGRIGNIAARPVLRDHEIVYLGGSGAEPDRRLEVSDLLVSVVGDTIVLRSRRLGRRVVPRMTNHHNHRLGSAVYRFLCSLQEQGVDAYGGWQWAPLGRAPFLPRVRVGRAVLSLARWRVTAAEAARFKDLTGARLMEEVTGWRRERGLDRWVVLAEVDNRLVVDLDSVLSVESFVHRLSRLDGAELEELWPPPDELVVEGPEGRFVHELAIPFVRTKHATYRTRRFSDPAIRPPSDGGDPAFERRFAPGSSWCYAKLYTGEAAADDVLTEVVAPLVERATAEGWCDRWFFLRFADPDHHVRLRLHGSPETLWRAAGGALNELAAPLIDDGITWRVQYDTYEREVERYGGPEGVVLAEGLFQADCEAALEILPRLEPGAAGADERWQLTLAAAAALLDDLGFDLDQQVSLIRGRRDAYAHEHRAGAGLRAAIGARFRRDRDVLESLLDRPETDHPLAVGFTSLRRRSAQIVPIAADLRALDAAGRLTAPLEDIAAAYLHLGMFRLLRGRWRAQELVLYDYLHRLLVSRQARTGAAMTAWEPVLTGALASRAEQAVDDLTGSLQDASFPEPSLMGGSSGAALLFAYLATTTGDSTYREAARQQLRDALRTLRGSGVSLAVGAAGVGWAAQHVGDLLDLRPIDPEGHIEAAILRAMDKSGDRLPFELLYGAAGIAVFALERMPRPGARELLDASVAHLGSSASPLGPGVGWLDPTDGSHNLGVSHGLGGVLAPLAGAAANGVDAAASLLEQAIAGLLAQQLEGGYPARVVPGTVASPARTAWCYGDPGIAAGLCSAGRVNEARSLARAVADRAVQATGVVDPGLCHGAAGVAHILNRIGQATEDEGARVAAVRWYEHTLDLLDEQPPVLGDFVFLTGAAGIALALLAATTSVPPEWDRALAITTTHERKAA